MFSNFYIVKIKKCEISVKLTKTEKCCSESKFKEFDRKKVETDWPFIYTFLIYHTKHNYVRVCHFFTFNKDNAPVTI